jgi:hypothetical protein
MHSPINVYQMWEASHGLPGGLWITRTTWANMCAQVTSVGEFKGPAPYFGNPKVFANLYSMQGQLKQSGFEISVPGTYKTWRQIETPQWALIVK